MTWPVIDLFSGCGGMSAGFQRRAPFKIVAAVDLQHGKPCNGAGALECNASYAANIGTSPLAADLHALDAEEFRAGTGLAPGALTVLLACPPCTDFSRAKPANHAADGRRNTLVARCGDFVEAFRPEFLVMENARELLTGHHKHHAAALFARLHSLGYQVGAGVHKLTRFGLPQIRERALVVACRDAAVLGLEDLWQGLEPAAAALTVRRAFARLAAWRRDNPNDSDDVAPGLTEPVRRRMAAVPADGGSWFELGGLADGASLLTRSMRQRLASGDLGSHPDVYGRMSFDRPAPTIKRECAHVGNGRYAHPVETRLLSVREMATLQGFPFDYHFPGRSLANRYRQIGDAVPPLVSYQLSALVAWIKTGVKPAPADWVLSRASLSVEDVVRASESFPKTRTP